VDQVLEHALAAKVQPVEWSEADEAAFAAAARAEAAPGEARAH